MVNVVEDTPKYGLDKNVVEDSRNAPNACMMAKVKIVMIVNAADELISPEGDQRNHSEADGSNREHT